MRDTITLRAYAKINIHLRIGQRDPASGYHALETIFQTVGLFDTLRFSRGEKLTLHGSLEGLPRDDSNIVLRAADALRAESGFGGGARIHLTKRVPAAAGLGGGSSDAAATLVGLNTLWKLQLRDTKLMQIAKTLGADVPFLLRGGTAAATGRGDRLRPLEPLRGRWGIVLVASKEGISTAEAYASLEDGDKAPDITMAAHRESETLAGLAATVARGEWPLGAVNNFERSIFLGRPRLAELTQDLMGAGAVTAHLSGSGPTVFGVFPTRAAARRAVGDIRLRPDERAFAVSPVAQSPQIVGDSAAEG